MDEPQTDPETETRPPKTADEARPGVASGAVVEPQPPVSPSMPLFYRRPRPLDSAGHGTMSLKSDIGYGFARATNSVPLTGAEFPKAAAHYPIVFTTQPAPGALAAVGVRPASNLFINADGQWDAPYIPAYVRRYPFIFLELNQGEQLALCIDEAAGALEPGLIRPLFRDGKPTEIVKQALQFCVDYQRDHAATATFVQALAARDLLVPYQVTMTLTSGEQLDLVGFQVVDEARFGSLPDEVFLDWRRRGWLGLVYAHLLSFGSWARLIKLQDDADRNRPKRT